MTNGSGNSVTAWFIMIEVFIITGYFIDEPEGVYCGMLLFDKRIVEELHNGNIIIEPFDQRQLGSNSYDCRLGKLYFQGDNNVDIIPLDIRDDICCSCS